MRRTIFILIFIFYYSIFSFSQNNEKYGWNISDVFNIGYGYNSHEKKLDITSLDFVKLSTSFGKATPYQRFGIGSEICEVVNFNNGYFASFFPINLHFIPWMKVETFENYDIQNESRYREGNYMVHSYSYDPNKTIYNKGMRSAILLTLSGTFWSAYFPKGAPDDLEKPLDKKLFNFRAAYIYNFKPISKNRHFGQGTYLSMSAEINNYTLFLNGKVNYFPSIGLRLSVFSETKFY
jgi:hypothetical protein